MQKFVDYMRRQGLVMVDTSKLKELAPGRPSDRANQQKGKWMGNVVCDEFDNSSAVTVYKNAVEPC